MLIVDILLIACESNPPIEERSVEEVTNTVEEVTTTGAEEMPQEDNLVEEVTKTALEDIEQEESLVEAAAAIAKEKVNETTEGVAERWQSVTSPEAKATAEALAGTAMEQVNQTKRGLQERWQSATSPEARATAEALADTAAEQVNETKRGLQEGWQSATSPEARATAEAVFKNTTTMISEKAYELKESVGVFIDSTVQKVSDGVAKDVLAEADLASANAPTEPTEEIATKYAINAAERAARQTAQITIKEILRELPQISKEELAFIVTESAKEAAIRSAYKVVHGIMSRRIQVGNPFAAAMQITVIVAQEFGKELLQDIVAEAINESDHESTSMLLDMSFLFSYYARSAAVRPLFCFRLRWTSVSF